MSRPTNAMGIANATLTKNARATGRNAPVPTMECAGWPHDLLLNSGLRMEVLPLAEIPNPPASDAHSRRPGCRSSIWRMSKPVA
jgi:hypothetical protein